MNKASGPCQLFVYIIRRDSAVCLQFWNESAVFVYNLVRNSQLSIRGFLTTVKVVVLQIHTTCSKPSSTSTVLLLSVSASASQIL